MRLPLLCALNFAVLAGGMKLRRHYSVMTRFPSPCSSTSMKSSRSQDATFATRTKTSLAAMAAVATRALMAA
jgi:hypothetical protein